MKSVKLEDGDLVAFDIDKNDTNRLKGAFKLRYEIFVENLKWLNENEEKIEFDKYDNYSVIFGAFQNNEIIGTVRATLSSGKFMLEEGFGCLLNKNHDLIKENSVEISRLGVKSSLKDDPRLKKRVVMLLYKILYKWAKENDIRYFYLVSTEKFLNSLDTRFSIPIHLFDKVASAPNCPKYRAALIDIREAEKLVHKLKFAIYNFFTR